MMRTFRILAILGSATAATAVAQSITIMGVSEPVTIGTQHQFKAILTGVSGRTAWSIKTGQGSIDESSGLYTAPTLMPASPSVTVKLDSSAVSANSTFQLRLPPASIISFSPKTILAGAFTITISGLNFTSKTVVALGSIPIVTKYVSATTLTASGTIPRGTTGQLQLSVITPGSGGGTFSSPTLVSIVPVNINPVAPSISVSPASVTLSPGKTQTFTAQLINLTGATKWTASSGTITPSGVFTAPATAGTTKITATSATNSAISGTATVTITAGTPGIQPIITSLSPTMLPFGPFALIVNGSNFTPHSVVSISGTNVSTKFVNAQQVSCVGVTLVSQQGTTASVTVSNGAAPASIAIGVQNPQVPTASAIRFLEQAAFGPRPADVMQVQQLGFAGWLKKEFAAPPGTLYQTPKGGIVSDMSARFLANAVVGNNQLRQKVAFVLSQFFVVSFVKLYYPGRVGPYEEMLYANAFSTYPNLLRKVTLEPAMGMYLDMVDNAKANPAKGSVANENYAREILQLFSIGVNKLNQDGTQVTVKGLPVPNYDQATIQSFSRVFTGWTYALLPSGDPNFLTPMVAVDSLHDATAKTLLNDVTLPAGQSAVQDLTAALDNITAHPNVAPFVSKVLIQHMVTSNPSATYVGNITKVFNDNGHGVKGDMESVITAILLDPEARAGDSAATLSPSTSGHLQEPVLYLANVLRSIDAQVTEPNYWEWELYLLGQVLFNSPTVFNFYTPQFRVAGIVAPEFQLQSPAMAVSRINLIDRIFVDDDVPQIKFDLGTSFDLTPWASLADRPAALVDALDSTFTHGQMPAAMKSDLITAVTGTTQGNLRRVEVGIFLIVTSSFYQVMH